MGESVKKERSILLFVGLFLAILVFVSIISSVLIPWWGYIETEEDYDVDGVLTDRTKDSEHVQLGAVESQDIGMHSHRSSIKLLLRFTGILMFLSLFSICIYMFLVFLYIDGRIQRKQVPLMFSSITFILLVFTPIVFGVVLPNALESDKRTEIEDMGSMYEAPGHDTKDDSFFGSFNETHGIRYRTEIREVWGPDLGWFLAFISAVLTAGSIAAFVAGKRRDPDEK